MEVVCRQQPLSIWSELLDLELEQWTKTNLFALALEDFRSDLEFLVHICLHQMNTLPKAQVGTGEEGVDFVVSSLLSWSVQLSVH